MKRIRITVEWPGACSESDWGKRLRRVIEKSDYSGLTRVTGVEAITDFGTTPPLTLVLSSDHENGLNRRGW